MANKYEAHTHDGKVYNVTTDQHHDDHSDNNFKKLLAVIIGGGRQWLRRARNRNHHHEIHLQGEALAIAMRTPILLTWRLSVAALAVAVCLPASPTRSEDGVARANRMAYQSALKCFVADGYASDERYKAGDIAKSDAYRAKARESFDLAYTAGSKLGLSDAQVGRDLDFAQKTELPRFIGNRNYLLETASTCKALGLM